MALLAALFTISGGVVVRGASRARRRQHGDPRRRFDPRQRRGDDGRLGAAHPAPAARQRSARYRDPRRRLLHLHRLERRAAC
jgi:hypothetical protein